MATQNTRALQYLCNTCSPLCPLIPSLCQDIDCCVKYSNLVGETKGIPVRKKKNLQVRETEKAKLLVTVMYLRVYISCFFSVLHWQSGNLPKQSLVLNDQLVALEETVILDLDLHLHKRFCFISGREMATFVSILHVGKKSFLFLRLKLEQNRCMETMWNTGILP